MTLWLRIRVSGCVTKKEFIYKKRRRQDSGWTAVHRFLKYIGSTSCRVAHPPGPLLATTIRPLCKTCWADYGPLLVCWLGRFIYCVCIIVSEYKGPAHKTLVLTNVSHRRAVKAHAKHPHSLARALASRIQSMGLCRVWTQTQHLNLDFIKFDSA